MSERVLHAAIRHEDQVYFLPRPARHGDVFKANCEVVNGIVRGKILGGEQGFVTDQGRFVDRELARELARAADQIIRTTGGEDTLYSEDMW